MIKFKITLSIVYRRHIYTKLASTVSDHESLKNEESATSFFLLNHHFCGLVPMLDFYYQISLGTRTRLGTPLAGKDMSSHFSRLLAGGAGRNLARYAPTDALQHFIDGTIFKTAPLFSN